jgi:hypothetical protein
METEIVTKNLVYLEDVARKVFVEFIRLENFRQFCTLFVWYNESNSIGRFFLTVQTQCDLSGERIEVYNAMWLNCRVKKRKALRVVTTGSFTILFLSLAYFSLPFTTKNVPVSFEDL